MTNFRTLEHGFREAIAGAHITHALFTTFAFETDFFEANIVPLLLDSSEALSSHEGVRRLQLNEKLCAMPDGERPEIEVFIDANAGDRAVPWVPYQLHAVRLGNAFHGKVIFLRLERRENGRKRVEWVLGCGSANLTLKGWWENIEAWHFTQPFRASAVPADIFGDLNLMLDWLRDVSPNRRHPVLDAWQAESPAPSKAKSGQRFVALLGRETNRFTRRLSTLSRAPAGTHALEVVSPFFCKDDHVAFAEAVRDSLGCRELRVWLPIDVWRDREGLLTKAQFDSLGGSETVRWAALARQSALRERCTPASIENKTPRTTHAKVIRMPGVFTFIGSVNFSRAAFDLNFEAGFIFADTDENHAWLEPSDEVPAAFAVGLCAPGESPEASPSGPVFDVTFDWDGSVLTVLPPKHPEQAYANAALSWRDTLTQTRYALVPGQAMSIPALAANFAVQPVIEIDWRVDASASGTVTLSVHQENLDLRPVPPELKLDVWSMIDLWRSTRGARIGAGDVWPRVIERIELQQNVSPDAPAHAPAREDLFERMTHIHGAFQQLRDQMRSRGAGRDGTPAQQKRARYYLCTDRTDSFKTMLARMMSEEGNEEFDEIESWVVLHWIKLIADEHAGIGDDVARGASELIETLRTTRLRDLPQDKLDWLSDAFLGDPDQVETATNDIRPKSVEVAS
ncbi:MULTISPECIES: phospholipase D-like domain-containing protein [unclassified Caballeronia]|uniref:phospholipase D-like domain-containing protein n=1 Tax=unclassified Caballeronia TaxID=2646786 RepID=UPI00202857A3|nr:MULTISPECIES: phospholipase D-like domain-containing protein [unclassified Caballeronia]